MRVSKTVAVALVLGALLGACSSGDDTEEANGAATPGETVKIQGIAYSPADMQIDLGTTVMWVNNDDVLHTVTSGRQGKQGVPGVSEDTDTRPDDIFDGQLDGENATFEFTFDEPGTYAYYCDVHIGMVGEIVVN